MESFAGARVLDSKDIPPILYRVDYRVEGLSCSSPTRCGFVANKANSPFPSTKNDLASMMAFLNDRKQDQKRRPLSFTECFISRYHAEEAIEAQMAKSSRDMCRIYVVDLTNIERPSDIRVVEATRRKVLDRRHQDYRKMELVQTYLVWGNIPPIAVIGSFSRGLQTSLFEDSKDRLGMYQSLGAEQYYLNDKRKRQEELRPSEKTKRLLSIALSFDKVPNSGHEAAGVTYLGDTGDLRRISLKKVTRGRITGQVLSPRNEHMRLKKNKEFSSILGLAQQTSLISPYGRDSVSTPQAAASKNSRMSKFSIQPALERSQNNPYNTTRPSAGPRAAPGTASAESSFFNPSQMAQLSGVSQISLPRPRRAATLKPLATVFEPSRPSLSNTRKRGREQSLSSLRSSQEPFQYGVVGAMPNSAANSDAVNLQAIAQESRDFSQLRQMTSTASGPPVPVSMMMLPPTNQNLIFPGHIPLHGTSMSQNGSSTKVSTRERVSGLIDYPQTRPTDDTYQHDELSQADIPMNSIVSKRHRFAVLGQQILGPTNHGIIQTPVVDEADSSESIMSSKNHETAIIRPEVPRFRLKIKPKPAFDMILSSEKFFRRLHAKQDQTVAMNRAEENVVSGRDTNRDMQVEHTASKEANLPRVTQDMQQAKKRKVSEWGTEKRFDKGGGNLDM